MGYYISVDFVSITIKKEKFVDALQAIKSLAGKETIHDGGGAHFAWVDNKFTQRDCLHEALKDWRWESEYNDDGDIDGIYFLGEKQGDDLLLFNAIAPFIEPNSYIRFRGEDGAQWEWSFDGVKLTVEDGINILQNDETINEVEQQRWVRIFKEFIDSTPELTIKIDTDEVKQAAIAAGDVKTYIINLFADFISSKQPDNEYE